MSITGGESSYQKMPHTVIQSFVQELDEVFLLEPFRQPPGIPAPKPSSVLVSSDRRHVFGEAFGVRYHRHSH